MNTAARAVLPTLNKVNEFFGNSIQLAGDLQFQMSSVEAISGASASDMEKLTAVAKEMGATTRYTAMDAANSLQQMALAGWEAEGMVAALPGVVNLAASANEDLSDMTRILVDGMNAFGMSGTENARKFADVLAKSATSSSTNVAQLGRALEACQGTAGNLGYAIEDVGTTLAAMANNGIKASVAGTALNTLLTRLSGGVKNAEDLMKELGVSMYYAADGFGHAEGEAKPLLEFLNELREGFKQFGSNAKEAQVAAYTLAGMRGMKGLLSITNMSDEAWKKLCEDVSEYAGAAEEIAGISMDNYRGQLYLLTSAWDALQTSVGEKFLPTAEEALRVLTDITTGVDNFVKSEGKLVNHGELVTFIAGFTTSLAGLLTVLTAVAGAVQIFRMSVTSLGLGALIGVGHTFAIVAALAAAAGFALADFASEATDAQRAGTALRKELQRQSSEFEKLNANSEAAIEPYRKQREETAKLIGELRELREAYDGNAAVGEKIKEKIKELNEALPGLNLSFNETEGAVNKTTKEIEAFNNAMDDAERAERESYVRQLTKELKAYQEQLEQAQSEYEDFLRAMNEKYGVEADENGILPLDPGSMLQSEIANYNDYRTAIDKAQEGIEQVSASLEKERAELQAKARAEMDALGITNMSVEAYMRTTESLEEMAQTIQKVAFEERQEIESLFGLFDKVEKKTTSLADMREAVESQYKYFEDYEKNLKKLETWAEQTGTDISSVKDKITDYSQESAAALGAMAKEIEKGDPDGAVRKYLEAVDKLNAEKDKLANFVTEQSDLVTAAVNQAGDNIAAAVRESDAHDEALQAMQRTVDGYKEGAGFIQTQVLPLLDSIVGQMRTRLAAIETLTTSAAKAASVARQSANGYVPASALRQFASGTLSAPSGMALVGEQGPELVIMRGGETVLTAAETRRLRMEAELLQNAMPESVRMAESLSKGDSRAEFAALRRNAETVRSLERYVQERAPVPIPGYASGTLNAVPGAAVVGERGPELMLMRGGERIIPATETARILQTAQSGGETASRIEAVSRIEEASRVMRAVSEKAARMEYEVSRTIRVIQQNAENRTTIQETIRVLQAFRDTERVIREAEMSRTSDSATRIIQTAERRERNIRTESDLSRIVRIIRTSGSRTEAETAERIFRTAERNASVLREAEQSRTSDSVSSIIRAAERRERNVRSESDLSRIVRIIRETSGSRTEAETAERIFRQREEAERIFRQSEAIQSQGERGGFGVESGGGYLEIAHNPSHFGGYGRESGDAITINLSPVYNIEAGVDPDALMPALRQNDKELRDLIIRTMKDYEYNKRRRALI